MEGPLVWSILSRASGVGRIRLAALMNAFPDPADAWRLSVSELLQIEGFGRQAAQSLVAVRNNVVAVRSAKSELEAARKAGLRLVALPDGDYPVRLRFTPDPPPFFYQAGPWTPDDRPMVAIIGTRKPTPYGVSVARRFAAELARAGAVIVSGMARGVDCAAHQGAVDAGGTTIAVLGGGADIIYPREAAPIYRAIRTSGAVISEQPPGAVPRSEHFPERNRIISGLAHGIIVVEAGDKSGTLITVTAALRQGREVFAVPGPITSPQSAGPHALLRDGASLATSPSQVLEDLGFAPATSAGSTLTGSSGTPESRLLGWMGGEPRYAEELASSTSLGASEVQAILTTLVLQGLVRQLPGGQYIRIG